MKRLLIVMVACAGLVGATLLLAGCGPRTAVAKDKMLQQIDKLLGETDVQRKDVEQGIDKIKKGMDKLVEGKARAEVKRDLLVGQVKDLDEKMKDAKSSLATLNDYLKSGQPKEIAGKTYSPDELKKLADRVVAAYKNLDTQKEGIEKARSILDGAVTRLDDRHKEGIERLAALESKLKEIDAEVVALKSLKDAAEAMGDVDKTVADNFASIEKKVTDLQVNVKTQLKVDEEKWKTVSASKDIDDVGKVVAETKGSQDTLNEISKILGK